MAKGALRFKNQTLERQPLERGRLRVVAGPDVGGLFVITNARATIGRGEENEVAIPDLKMSRKHALIMFGPQGPMIQDLGSSNGIVINGKAMKQALLRSGDQIALGMSVLEFLGHDSTPQALKAPPVSLDTKTHLKLVGGDVAESTKTLQKNLQTGAAATAAGTRATAANPAVLQKNKKFMITVGVLLLLSLLMPQAELQVKKRKARYEPPTEVNPILDQLRRFMPKTQRDSDVVKRAEMYFKEGYREYVEGNYLRAKTNFDTALQIFPDHKLAQRYTKLIETDMDEEAKEHKRAAKLDEAANRKTSALNHYDAVRRLYHMTPKHAHYVDADKAYEAVKKDLDAQKEK